MMGCNAKKFQDRMSHRGSGKSEGEKRLSGLSSKSSPAMTKMTAPMSAKEYPHKQSKDGNGGNG